MKTETLFIYPPKGWTRLKLRDVWRYGDLLGFLAWRNIKVRYKQTLIGVTWALLQPLLPLLVFSVIFGRLAKIPSEGVPYPLYAYSALILWQLFANSLTQSANSLISDEKLITKVYFPRLVIPLSSIFSSLLDFAIASGFFLVLMFVYQLIPTARMVFAPLFIGMTLLAALGMGFWLSALNVQYRDVRYALPFLFQFWLFASPVVYPSRLVPEKWLWFYGLNPMAGVIEGFRWAMLGTPVSVVLVAVSSIIIAIVLVSGLYYFRRMEKTFADVI